MPQLPRDKLDKICRRTLSSGREGITNAHTHKRGHSIRSSSVHHGVLVLEYSTQSGGLTVPVGNVLRSLFGQISNTEAPFNDPFSKSKSGNLAQEI